MEWWPGDEIAAAIARALREEGAEVASTTAQNPEIAGTDAVLTFAPYGQLAPLARRLAALPATRRPRWLHWSLESLPNATLPPWLLRALAVGRSRAGSVLDGGDRLGQIGARTTRFRILGDYLRAANEGILTAMASASSLQSEAYRALGLRAHYVPWGVSENWYADLGLERDIDVLWMGKRRTRRRRAVLDRLRSELGHRGIELRMIDGIEHPFVFGDERTRLLNRVKVVVNVLPRAYDPGFVFRFVHSAANGCLTISEPVMPHNPEIVEATHYVTANIDTLPEVIESYVREPQRAVPIVDAAREFVRTRLALRASVRNLLHLLEIGERT